MNPHHKLQYRLTLAPIHTPHAPTPMDPCQEYPRDPLNIEFDDGALDNVRQVRSHS